MTDLEQEATPEAEAGDPVVVARNIYQSYVRFWEEQTSPGSIAWQKKLEEIVEAQGTPKRTAEDLAGFNAECGFPYPVVFFLERSSLGEKEKFALLVMTFEREAEKMKINAERYRREHSFSLRGRTKIFDDDDATAKAMESDSAEAKRKAEIFQKAQEAL